ncbi:NPC intracellular cholesterol transporter 2-like [Zerene cesonia]|uniref:NPC intracellular cholesterol transporter 2-like n=1 Tax=Zerene cesonia TaxID=33412 RepID=UPI0018E4E796|nr:NPC intracellular cholesterol transporter 2-like [Zerene cesonia]
MFKYIALFAFVAVAQASTNVQTCRVFSGALPTTTTIEGCRDPPCLLPQGRDAVIHMTFNAPRNINSMRTLATAFIMNIPVPYSLGKNEVTCNFITNTQCPVNSGQQIQYTLRMFIESTFPVGISTTIEFRIVDQRNSAVVCVRVPIRITAGRELGYVPQVGKIAEIDENQIDENNY